MTTTAEKISKLLDDNGANYKTDDGRTLEQLCAEENARKEFSLKRECSRYEFSDGSAIVDCGSGWDLQHPDCTCGYCWEGAELLCGEVRTVIGDWRNYTDGIFGFKVLDGYIAAGAPYVCSFVGKLRRKQHEDAVVRLAETEWGAPDDRHWSSITFDWSRVD